MSIKLYTVGGYSEVGKNMTLFDFGEDALVCDQGLYLPPIVEIEDPKRQGYAEKELKKIKAIPDDDFLGDIKSRVRAILVSHAHLDHVGAIPYMGHNYNAEVVGTPYTIEILKALTQDNNIKFSNKIRTVSPNSSFLTQGRKNYEVEFLNITHSTLQASLIVIHTEKGAIVYANDFKFDNTPILGKKPNYERLKEIAKEGVLALVVDSLYSDTERKTPSEKIARGLLEDVLLTTNNSNACIITTTFSSHIARLKSIVDCAKQLDRKIIFLGRSLNRYVSAANTINLAPFMPDIQLLSYRNQMERAIRRALKDREKYLFVVTGHQGEPGSILDRFVRGALPFKFEPQDHVIFSSSIIPSPINIENRKQLEKKLKEKRVRIFTDVHVSGHCGREDLRDIIEMLQPQHLIPAHGDLKKRAPLAELAVEMGYKLGYNVHLLQNGQKLVLDK
jgi:ribonuclease J